MDRSSWSSLDLFEELTPPLLKRFRSTNLKLLGQTRKEKEITFELLLRHPSRPAKNAPTLIKPPLLSIGSWEELKMQYVSPDTIKISNKNTSKIVRLVDLKLNRIHGSGMTKEALLLFEYLFGAPKKANRLTHSRLSKVLKQVFCMSFSPFKGVNPQFRIIQSTRDALDCKTTQHNDDLNF